MGRGVAKDGSEKCARETYCKKKTKRQTKKKKRLLFSVLHQNLKYPITTAGQPLPTGPPLWTDYNKSHIIRSRSLSRHSISAFRCVRGHDRLPLTFSGRPINSAFKLIHLFLQHFRKWLFSHSIIPLETRKHKTWNKRFPRLLKHFKPHAFIVFFFCSYDLTFPLMVDNNCAAYTTSYFAFDAQCNL